MKSNRKETSIAGFLYLIGIIAGILSIVPAIDNSDYLVKAVANSNQVLIGALFQFIMTIAYLGFAIVLYPLLKKHNEYLSLGFLCFRIIATVLNVIGFVILLILLSISYEYIRSSAPNLSHFQTLGDILKLARDFVNHIAMILTLSIGGILYYLLLLKAKLVPRWISLWGLFGTLFCIIASVLVMFKIIDIITPIYIGLNLPLVLIEIILAIWLIAKGFNIKTKHS